MVMYFTKLVRWLVVVLLLLMVVLAGMTAARVKQLGGRTATDVVWDLPVKPGQGLYAVLTQLPVPLTTIEWQLLKLWVVTDDSIGEAQQGFYRIAPGTELRALLVKLQQGDVTHDDITLVEGLRYEQWLQQISNHPFIDTDKHTERMLEISRTTTDPLYDKLVALDDFCVNNMRSLQGCLLADTYRIAYQDTVEQVVTRAYLAMAEFLEQSLAHDTSPFATRYELLVMSSIIEKETGAQHERGLISGVFQNRLERGMRLQTDPTVIYGLGAAFTGDLTRSHLRTDTPYNTYTRHGLPPTPIAMVGRDSILAALYPEVTDYLFFVAKGDGTHQFSKTLAEHNAAVHTYQVMPHQQQTAQQREREAVQEEAAVDRK